MELKGAQHDKQQESEVLMYNDIHFLPELLVEKISYDEFCKKNKKWFERVSAYWFRRIHRPELKMLDNLGSHDGVGIDPVSDSNAMFNGCNREDLEQLAKEWVWRFTFGIGCMAFDLQCCDVDWKTPNLYYRHRCRVHKEKRHIDIRFSKYVAFNTVRKIRCYALNYYTPKRNHNSLPYEILREGSDSKCETILDSILYKNDENNQHYISFELEDIFHGLDERGKRTLEKIMFGELFVNKNGKLIRVDGSNPSNIDYFYVAQIADIIMDTKSV